jgi:hypothetical protein
MDIMELISTVKKYRLDRFYFISKIFNRRGSLHWLGVMK